MTRRLFLVSFALLLSTLPLLAADGKPVRVLIIAGDHGHNWKETTPFIKDLLVKAGMTVDVTETPAKDLTADNLAKYDVLFLNYKDTKNATEGTKWSDENKRAFADAVKGGKGLYVYHHASSAFTSGTEWDKEFERVIAGGWRKQGNHGKKHEFTVKIAKPDHPITKGMPAEFAHSIDELYQNSVMLEDSEVLATAWSDKTKDPKNTDKHEPVVWTNKYGQGRVYNNLLGHDVAAMQAKGFQMLLIRGVEWAATGEVKTP
ncbi:MAG: ThuA domain-containing protein [Planctomycetota bacterium]|nr:ThuA domain-containing protein [Planctomycetota bacterium]